MTLAEAPVGTDVILARGRDDEEIAKIERKTATMIIVNGFKFKINGNRCGRRDAWNDSWIRIPIEGEIEELKEKLRRRRVMFRISCTKWDELSTERLDHIHRILSIKP